MIKILQILAVNLPLVLYGWEHRRLSLVAKELNWSQKQFNDYVNARPERFMLENMSESESIIKNQRQNSQEINGIKFRYYLNDNGGVNNVHPE